MQKEDSKEVNAQEQSTGKIEVEPKEMYRSLKYYLQGYEAVIREDQKKRDDILYRAQAGMTFFDFSKILDEKSSTCKASEEKSDENKAGTTVEESKEPIRPIDIKIKKALLQIIKDGRIKHAYDYHVIMQILCSKFGMTFNNAQQFVDYLRETLGITHLDPKADNLNKYISKMCGNYPKWTWKGKNERFADRCIKIANFFIVEMEKLQ